MNAKEIAFLVAVLAAGLAVGYYIGSTSDKDVVGATNAFVDTVTDLETNLRKGGPPTPEAMSNTDTPDTTGSTGP